MVIKNHTPDVPRLRRRAHSRPEARVEVKKNGSWVEGLEAMHHHWPNDYIQGVPTIVFE